MSDDVPLVVVHFITKNRTDYALRTIEAARRNLIYPNLAWFIDDGGSRAEHFNAVNDALQGCNLIGSHQEPIPPSAHWNRAIRNIFRYSDIYLRLEDDWVLSNPLNIQIYVEAMSELPIGLMRLSNMTVDLKLKSVSYKGNMFFQIVGSGDLALVYSGNPNLTHRRFHAAHGYFPEYLVDPDNSNRVLYYHAPGECEQAMDYQLRQIQTNEAPQIWWPLAVGEWGAFGHIGAVNCND